MKQYLCILWSLGLCQKNIPWQHLLSSCLTSVQLVLVTELCYTWKVRAVFCEVLLLSSFPSLQPWCFCPAEELVWQTREVAAFVPQPAVILILLPKGGVGKGRFWTLVSSGPDFCGVCFAKSTHNNQKDLLHLIKFFKNTENNSTPQWHAPTTVWVQILWSWSLTLLQHSICMY